MQPPGCILLGGKKKGNHAVAFYFSSCCELLSPAMLGSGEPAQGETKRYSGQGRGPYCGQWMAFDLVPAVIDYVCGCVLRTLHAAGHVCISRIHRAAKFFDDLNR